jgi:hypothetical protein
VPAWTYAATDLLTGQVLSDTLPLDVSSFSWSLNGGGTMSAALNLDQAYMVNAPFVAALACRRAVVWALTGGQPAWCGLVTDWPDSSRAQGTLPITAQTLDWIWGKRLITDSLAYPAIDIFTAFCDLATYGLTKRSSYISATSPAIMRTAAYLAMVATQGRVASAVIPSAGSSGVPWTASYAYSDFTPVAQAWQAMCSSTGLEYYFQPGLTADGALSCALQLGYTTLGRPQSETGLVFTYPGNLLDYGYPITGSQSSNMIWASAPPNGSAASWISQYPHGADLADLASYPLFEGTASWANSVVTAQSQVDGYADGQVALATAGMTTPVLVVGGSEWPPVTYVQLGDAVQLAATSPLHPPASDGSPGLQQQLRITSITVRPSGPNQSESYQLNTSAVIAA